jgi:hypothetical protein
VRETHAVTGGHRELRMGEPRMGTFGT